MSAAVRKRIEMLRGTLGSKEPAAQINMQQPLGYSNILDVLQGLWMPSEADERSSSGAEQSERGSPELYHGGNSSTRSEGRAGKAAMTLLVLLLNLLAVSGEAPASGGLRRVPRRGRRDHAFSRTLSDHSSSSMPHGFYSRSSDVSAVPVTNGCSLAMSSRLGWPIIQERPEEFLPVHSSSHLVQLCMGIILGICVHGRCTASLPHCCPCFSAACGALRLGACARAVLRRAIWFRGT